MPPTNKSMDLFCTSIFSPLSLSWRTLRIAEVFQIESLGVFLNFLTKLKDFLAVRGIHRIQDVLVNPIHLLFLRWHERHQAREKWKLLHSINVYSYISPQFATLWPQILNGLWLKQHNIAHTQQRTSPSSAQNTSLQLILDPLSHPLTRWTAR